METAENPDIIRDTLDSIDALAEEKALNIVWLMKTLESEAAMFKTEEIRLAERRRTVENRLTSLRDYLRFCINESGKEKIRAGTFTIGMQKSPASVAIVNMDDIPAQYMKQTQAVDRNALLEALKHGENVPGAQLLDNEYHIRIR